MKNGIVKFLGQEQNRTGVTGLVTVSRCQVRRNFSGMVEMMVNDYVKAAMKYRCSEVAKQKV